MKEFLSALFGGLVALAVAAAGAVAVIAGGAFEFWTKDRELDIRMIDVALTILSSESQDQKSIPARRFALRSLRKYSEVDISEEDFNAWLTEGTLPHGDFPIWNNPFFQFGAGALGSAPIGGGPIGGGSDPQLSKRPKLDQEVPPASNSSPPQTQGGAARP